MTDDTISRLGSRLGSHGFTPPKPIELGEAKHPRAPRVRAPRQSDEKFEAPPAIGHVFKYRSPQISPVENKTNTEAEVDVQVEAERDADFAFEAETNPDLEVPVDFDETAIEGAPDGLDNPAKPAPKFSLRKRFAFLAAIIAVPAFAASGNLGAIPGSAPTEEAINAALAGETPMPFEQAGMNFPGSAFYYIDESGEEGQLALPAGDPLGFGGEFGSEVGALVDAGPPASGFFIAGSAASQARAKQCLAQAIWYEAGAGNEAGQRAIAQVVLNRVAHPNWPGSVCGVVYDGAERSSGCQFTFTCDGRLAGKPEGEGWVRAQQIATDALNGQVFAPIGLATHYHTRFVNPGWAAPLKRIGTIGSHQFYRDHGEKGEKSAFTGTYAGIEPEVSGRTRRAEADFPAPSYSPPARPSSYTAPPQRTPRASSPSERVASQAPAPRDTAPAATPSTPPPASVPEVPRSGSIKPEYSNAGQWKKNPNGAGSASPSSTDD